jgi:uncharacterized cupredoxin-like copper-binding protein
MTEENPADGGGTAVAVAERPGELERIAATEAGERRKDRLWLPLLIPVGAILVVALFTINISRVLLATHESKSTAVVIGSLVTVAILVGATIISAIPKLRTSSLVITMSVVTAVVLLSGSLVLGAAESKEEGGGEPAGEAIQTTNVEAYNFRFQADNFDVPAGVNEFTYESFEGSHTLVFAEPQFSYFKLVQPGGQEASKFEAVDGETYTIYCDLPGHREAGMEATVTVKGTGGTPEPGTETPSTTLEGDTSSTTAPDGQSEVDPAQQSGNETGN